MSPARAPAGTPPSPASALGQAAHWFALLGGTDGSAATPADLRRWRRWLAADASHQRAWQGVQTISDMLRRVHGCDGTTACLLFEAAAASRRQRRARPGPRR